MEELIVIGAKETALPNNWLTAAQCRELAESWKEEELIPCIDCIMIVISRAAKEGKFSTLINIKNDKPRYFYDALKGKLNSLGYRVSMLNYPDSDIYSTVAWGIYW